MKGSHLYIVAASIWGIPGTIITVKGVSAYLIQPPERLWWLLLITAFVLVSFYFMFTKIEKRYSKRISKLAEKAGIWQTFPPRGWALLLLMMGLGIAIRYIPGVTPAFTASFYSGLGPMLLLSALRFLSRTK